jgi:hypothetical protein
MSSITKYQVTNKEGNEDGGIHYNKGQHCSPAVAETVGNWTSQENTDECTTLAGLEERALPFRLYGHTTSFNRDAVSILERGEGDKVTVQKHVKGFHDLAAILAIVSRDMWLMRKENAPRSSQDVQW